MSRRIDRLLGRGAIRGTGVGPGRRGHGTAWAEPEEQPEWVVRQPDGQTGRRTGLYHLKRSLPAIRTLCGLEKPGWQRWPPSLDRPPVEMCCRRCMNVATREVMEGRYEHE